jgi:D-alanine--poly(phosphoribitol) ligase subunit 2
VSSIESSTISLCLREFFRDSLQIDFDAIAADESTDLFESGLIDSFGFIELVGFIESTFSIQISDEELASDRVGSFAGLVAMISEKTTQ